MDPLSTASAVLAVVTAGVKLSTSLYDIVDSLSGAGEEITGVASDLSFFVVVVDELGKIFELPEKPYTDILESKVKEILHECREVFKGIQRMINRVDKGDKPVPIAFRQKVQWVFRESRVKAVKARLESLKSTLGLMLQTLRLHVDRRQNAEYEHKLLENLLRTQQATLQNLETVEKTEIAQKDIARSKTVRQQQTSKTPPPKPEASAAPYRSTSHVLSLALPSSPEKSAKASVNPTTAEDAAGYSFDDTPFNPGVHDHSSATGVEQSIYYGGFGPHSAAAKLSQSSHIYRQNIDLLFSRWTQSLPHEGKTSNSEGSMQNQTASSIEEGRHDDGQEAAFRNFTLNAKRGELCAKLKKLSDNILVTKAEKQRKAQSYEAAIKNLVAGEDDLRRQNDDLDAQSERIDRRLAKWKAGMIEMSDIAFRRLQGELERIALDKANLQEKLTEFEIQRHGLEHQYEIALKADEECLQSLEADQLEAEKVLASLQKERERKISNTPVQETKPIDMGWLNDNASHEESSDEEDEPEPGANEDRATDITQTAGSGPDVQAGHPTSSMADSAHSSDGIDGVPDGAVPSMKDGQPSWTCVRKGWKPPERFYGGTNTLSYVTQLAGQNPIWFKASQDAYNFFLGASTKTFYTISLVPSDLASYETAKICWTVIAKSWATPTALSAAGWPYTEDSVGNVWIHKDLNWAQITNLYQMSCSIFDNAIFEEARMILTKRSAASDDRKTLKDLRRVFRSKSSESDVAKRLEPNPDHHPAFFKGLQSTENAAKKPSKSLSP